MPTAPAEPLLTARTNALGSPATSGGGARRSDRRASARRERSSVTSLFSAAAKGCDAPGYDEDGCIVGDLAERRNVALDDRLAIRERFDEHDRVRLPGRRATRTRMRPRNGAPTRSGRAPYTRTRWAMPGAAIASFTRAVHAASGASPTRSNQTPGTRAAAATTVCIRFAGVRFPTQRTRQPRPARPLISSRSTSLAAPYSQHRQVLAGTADRRSHPRGSNTTLTS